jgi:hypothetical protein
MAADSPSPKKPLDPARKAYVLNEVLRRRSIGEKVDPAEWKDFVDAQNEGATTGPAIGERAPDFALSDQNGASWTLDELKGKDGLLLVFTRSADW